MDASHFCNLGIVDKYQGMFSIMGIKDRTLSALYNNLEATCANTRWLPQRVNIGPDRRVDKFHGDLATKILESGKPPVSVSHLKEYVLGATMELSDYQKSQVHKGNHGIAACVDAYIDCYLKDVTSLWRQISGNVESECMFQKLEVDRYLSLS
jgi:hypothetical protein